STVHKQVYIYGGLDRGPTQFTRTFGQAWGIGGWLLTPFLQKIGFEAAQKLRERVAAEIKTTFASTYTKEISLAEALSLQEIAVYGRLATAAKYLITPNKGCCPARAAPPALTGPTSPSPLSRPPCVLVYACLGQKEASHRLSGEGRQRGPQRDSRRH